MAQIADFFGEPLSCVYCGSREIKRWDHLIAVTHGGETVLGNMVPACAPCDDSKQHKPYREWIVARASTLGIEETVVTQRIARLEAYAETFRYEHTSMLDRLTEEERDSMVEIQTDLTALKIRVENLISQYRRRTGGK
jgi:hypothetical protein